MPPQQLPQQGRGTFTFPGVGTYTGEWRGGKMNGQGTYTYADGDRYEGEWHDNKRHGQGTEIWADGGRYEGEWRDDKMHGQGTETWADGSRYEGKWRDDKMHGQGTLTSAAGGRYEGEWHDGKKHGQGTYASATGSRYEGEWHDNKRHGQGTRTWATGSRYEGAYRNGKMHGQGTETMADGGRYEGAYRNGKSHGQGTHTWADGSRYEGEWHDDKMHGQGTRTWADGGRYEGAYRNNKRHGQGTSTTANGSRYEGEWHDNLMHGQGTYTTADGGRYEGAYRNGKKHGQGTYTTADGIRRYEGAWHDDKVHGQGTFTAAVFGSFFFSLKTTLFVARSLTGAFAHGRPTAGELTAADGRRYAVQYAHDCATIWKSPAPSSMTLLAGLPAAAAGSSGSAARARGGAGGGGGGGASNGASASGVRNGNQAGASGGDEQSGVGSKRKRLSVYGSLLSPAAKAARTGSPGDGGTGRRPAENAVEAQEHVNVLFQWQWRAGDGTYVPFDKGQSIEIETCYRRRAAFARVWGTQFPAGPGEQLKCIIDLDDYTACVFASEWVTAVRRWCRDTPMGDSWDQQRYEVSIVDVLKGWRDYTVVETTVSQATHELVKVQRIQNRRQLRLWEAEEASLKEKRGGREMELSCTYAWHGSGEIPPAQIAAGEGFMMQCPNCHDKLEDGMGASVSAVSAAAAGCGRAVGGEAALRSELEAVKRERDAMLGDRARFDAVIVQKDEVIRGKDAEIELATAQAEAATGDRDVAIRARDTAVGERDAALRDKQEGTCRMEQQRIRMEAALALAIRDRDQALRDTTRADAEIREKNEAIRHGEAAISARDEAIRGKDAEIARLRALAYGVEVTDVETGVTSERVEEGAGATPRRTRLRQAQAESARVIAAAQERLVALKREHTEERAAGAAVHSELRASVDAKVQAAVKEALAQVADALECACCLERLAPGAAVALECGHTYCNRAVCASSSVKECPECRQPIGARVPLFGALANVCELLPRES